MWALNYIKCVSVGGSHNNVSLLSMHGADGALIFFKTYWKQRFNYEIKLYGGLDDIHEDIYHWYVLYCRSVHFFVGLKDRRTNFV